MIVLGAMSGTSTDGVDVAALEVDSVGNPIRCLAHASVPFEAALRAQLLRLQEVPGKYQADEDPFALMLMARQSLTDLYRFALTALVNECALGVSDIAAIGVHGQTLRHRPDLGYTYQMFDPAQLAVQMGCTVVADFRSADVALGGQGAPLVPPFHAAWLSQRIQGRTFGVLNLGGFSNLTCIGADGLVKGGGDCGPANALMDYWAKSRFQCDFDARGDIAAQGRVSDSLLAMLKQHPYFLRSWPKSTGRDDFTTSWLEDCIANSQPLSAQDVMSTLLQLTVDTVATCAKGFLLDRLFVCGGGANNAELMRKLADAISPSRLQLFDDMGLASGAVEAAAFAWLAARRVLQLPSNCPVVTGSSRVACLGAVYLPA